MLLRYRCLFFLMSVIFLGAPGAWGNDTEGLFAGIRFGHELADVNYTKNVEYNPNATGVPSAVPNGTSMTAGDSATDGFNAFSANLGYRAFMSDRVYVSGEVEGTVYSNEVQGFIEGTYQGEDIPIPSEQVFPGAWKVDKNHSLGFNARLGYVPQGLTFLGEGRSVYLITGVKWLSATFEAAYDNRGAGPEAIKGVVRERRNAVPWLIGGGVEFGSSTNRFDVRIHYSSWSMDYVTGDGATAQTARVPHDFDFDEVAISLGYTRSFNLGM